MSGFATAMTTAQQAQRQAWEAEIALDSALSARGVAVARAWRDRPGGMFWADFVALFNEGLPQGARLSVSALRTDEKQHRRPG